MRPKTGTGNLRRDVRIQHLKGKMIMTFKTNIPERWLDNPRSLPTASIAESVDGDKVHGPGGM